MKIWPFNLLDFLEVETQAKKDDLLAGIVLAMSNLEKQDEKSCFFILHVVTQSMRLPEKLVFAKQLCQGL